MTWDKYFYDICVVVASKSPCLSRKIGAILVRDNSIISTGYNGPPKGVIHCGPERNEFQNITGPDDICIRKLYGYESGKGLELCPAVHAEMNAVINAARKGASTLGSTLYMNCVIPCKQCMGILINAGVKEIVIEQDLDYDTLSKYMQTSDFYPSVRKFSL